MSENKPSRWKGCLLGCGGLLLLVILGVGGCFGMTVLEGRRAIAARAALDAAYPSPETYVPPFDDAFDPERVRRYLEVRAELLDTCATFEQVQAAFGEMLARGEELERREEDPSLGEILHMLGGVGGVVGATTSLAHDISSYQLRRDEALLAREMGMGEATWIQAAVNGGLLGHAPVFVVPDGDRGDDPFRERLNHLVRGMIDRHLAELQAALDGGPEGAAPGHAGNEDRASLAARVAWWQAELDALAADVHRLPFQDGLPPAMTASLEPFRAEFERTWCEATSGLDLMHAEGRGTRIVVR